MNPRTPWFQTNRRAFLRYGVLGGLAAVTVKLVARQRGQVCISDGLCRGCEAFDDCGLPRALSAKQAATNQQPS